jgi:hypothetical protein
MENTLIISAGRDGWQAAVRCTNVLLKAGLPVAWSAEGIDAATDGQPHGQRFPAGSFIVLVDGMAERAWVSETAQNYGARAQGTLRPFEAEISWLRPAEVALFADAGTPYSFADILGQLGFQNAFITSAEIRAGGLASYDALFIPGGGWHVPRLAHG